MKAPWTWTEKGKNSGYYSSLKDADGYPIIMLHDIYTGYAECGEELVMEIDDPVALLIAAAPDLLAACKFVAQRLQGWADGLDCAGDSSSSMALQGWADDLKAAVKKAEGVK